LEVRKHTQVSLDLPYAEAAEIIRNHIKEKTGILFEDVHFHTSSKNTVLLITSTNEYVNKSN
jgi:hypothetical protein